MGEYKRKLNLCNDYFDVITVSGDILIKKPDERIFKLTLEKLGCLASDCTYIDDRRLNLAAAQSLSMDNKISKASNNSQDS